MTPDEFGSALAEFAPDDTKVVVTITSDRVVFSAIPRSKDSKSPPAREFAVEHGGGDIDEVEVDYAIAELFPEKQAELTADEEKSKERVAEKIHDGKPEFASMREEKRVTSQRKPRSK